MKKNILNIALYSAGAILLIVFLVQICSSFVTNNLTIETAEAYTYNDVVEFTGIVLRNEVCVLTDDDCGYVSYSLDDGQRVAVKGEIATYLSGDISEQDKHTLSDLNHKLNVLEQTLKSAVQNDTVTLDRLVKDDIAEYLNKVESGKYDESSASADALQIQLNRKTIKNDGSAYFEDLSKEYSAQKTSLLNNLRESENIVLAPVAGCFFSGYDGYEYIKADDYIDITADKYYQLMKSEPLAIDSRYIGKLQNSPVWYFAGAADVAYKNSFTAASTVKLQFTVGASGVVTYQATVVDVDSDGENVIVVFSCNQLTEKEFGLRKETCNYIVKSYSGIKISNEALRVVDGSSGVYVLVAQKVVFKPVTVLYSGDSFAIVTASASTTARTLGEYDEVIIGGTDLFDGKVVNIG